MTRPDDLRERIARALYQGVLDGSNGYVEGQEANVTVDPADPEEILMVDSGVCFADLADAVIQELGNVVNEGGAWGVIDLLIEIAGPRCTADEGNRP